jgi:hypothetical protein
MGSRVMSVAELVKVSDSGTITCTAVELDVKAMPGDAVPVSVELPM